MSHTMPYSVTIDGKGPVDLVPHGFINIKTAHAHLFKHVLRLTDQLISQQTEELDPEGWSDFIPDPPLPTSVSRRRALAMEKVAGVPGCETARLRDCTGDKPCSDCRSNAARKSVSERCADLLEGYVESAQDALSGAFSNPTSTGPRLVAYREPNYVGVTIRAYDHRKLFVLANLDECTGDVHFVTCYRKTQDKKQKEARPNGISLNSLWLDECRLASSLRRDGMWVDVQIHESSKVKK